MNKTKLNKLKAQAMSLPATKFMTEQEKFEKRKELALKEFQREWNLIRLHFAFTPAEIDKIKSLSLEFFLLGKGLK